MNRSWESRCSRIAEWNEEIMSATVDVRRADTRPHTQITWLDSRHSFSFGPHYDPANTGHGFLVWTFTV